MFQAEHRKEKREINGRHISTALTLNLPLLGLGRLLFGADAKTLDANNKHYFFYMKFIERPPKKLGKKFKVKTYGIQIINYSQRVKIDWYSRCQIVQRVS